MKKPIAMVLVLLIAVFIVIQFRNAQQIDIIGDLEEIRNTPVVGELDLMQHHENIRYFDSLVSTQNYKKALSFMDSLIDNFNSDYQSRYLFEKGRLLFNMENYEESKRVLTDAIVRSDSLHLKAFVWRGYSYTLLGSCDSAEIDLKYAVRRNGSFQRDYDKAMKYCLE